MIESYNVTVFQREAVVMKIREEIDYARADEHTLAQWREEDFIYAFCVDGKGHSEPYVEAPDRSVGIFGWYAECPDCGTDLSDDEELNPASWGISDWEEFPF
jgi:hypothetical protein